jgi:two-component system LytT family sensor kinase
MFVAAIWLWPAVFGVLRDIIGSRFFEWGDISPQQLLFSFGDWFGYAIFTPIIFKLAEKWPIVRPHVRRRAFIHLGWALVFCVGWAVGGKILGLILALMFEPTLVEKAISEAGNNLTGVVAKNVLGWINTTVPFGVVVYTTVAAMAHAISYFTDARDREVQLARLNEQLSSARFSALQAQVNPHFLFNTLNTIAVLVRDNDKAGAVRIVEQLSDMLRRTLSRSQANEWPFDDELELVRQYLAIEQARFSDRLRPEFEIAGSLGSAAIPSFAVQHLVENAIRHGIAKRAEAARVRVAARRDGATLEITVTDDGPGVNGETPPAGHGLDNTRERLRALHGEGASLTVVAAPGGGTIATLRVPYRELALSTERVAQ